MANPMTMSDPRRARLEIQIMERLQALDEATLRDLDAWLAQDDPQTGRRGSLTRRQLLAMVGGAAALGAGGVGATWLLSGSEQAAPVAEPAAAPTLAPIEPTVATAPEEEFAARLAALRSENQGLNERLEANSGLISLYEQLEGTGLDRVVEGGMALVATALGRMAQGAAGLREGLALAEQRINELDQSFAGLDQGLARAEGVVTNLSNLMQGLEDRLQAAGEPVAPITEALGNFFKGLIERIPAVGPRIIEAIERVEEIVSAIPESIENINQDVLRPLRERFFPREGEDVTVRLIDPLTEILFAPAERLLGALEELGQTWQSALQQPVQEKLDKRADIRQRITVYKSEREL